MKFLGARYDWINLSDGQNSSAIFGVKEVDHDTSKSEL